MPDIAIKNISIMEPTGKVRFSSLENLYGHVRKHVLDGRSEQWSQLIDADQIAEARREIREQLPEKPMLKKTVSNYRGLIAKSVVQLAKAGKCHQHLYWEPVLLSRDGKRIVPEGMPDDACQTLEAWDLDKKILIIAKSFVSNGEFSPYVLCTAFRPFPKLSGNSLRKNIRKKLRERQTIRRGTVTLALHDEQ